VREQEAEKMNGLGAALARLFLGSPLKLWASVGHWAIWHFDLGKYTEKQKPRVGGWVGGGQQCRGAGNGRVLPYRAGLCQGGGPRDAGLLAQLQMSVC
jgi:hypothetical protein